MINLFVRKMKKNKKGFTLIELIVVIAILGILAAIAIPRFSGMQENANVKAVKATLKNIDTAVAVVAAEKNVTLANVAPADVATALGTGWGYDATNSKFTGTSPDKVTYSLTAAGAAQAVVDSTVKWPSGLASTVTSADLQTK